MFVLVVALLAVGGFAAHRYLGEGSSRQAAESSKPPKRGPAGDPVPTLAVTDLLAEDGQDPDSDPYAEEHLREESPEHLESVRWSGDFLRVYTDLDEGDTGHPAARGLCEAALDYLKATYSDTFKDDDPVVFVHARRSGNGHVVLVNSVTGPCRPVETR